MAALGPSFVRNRAITTLDLGVAYIHFNEIDQAAVEVGNAAYLALHNRSARLVEQIHAARAQMAPWQDSGAVKALDQRLAAYHLVP